MMLDPSHPIAELLREDRRYKLEAYVFVFEALNYAHNTLGLGQPDEQREKKEKSTAGKEAKAKRQPKREAEEEVNERHLTGQELCEAIRLYALEQYGLLAKCVLNSWGVYTTGDFGEIVFNLIRIEQMRKTDADRREDFDNVFDFERDLVGRFKIDVAEPKSA